MGRKKGNKKQEEKKVMLDIENEDELNQEVSWLYNDVYGTDRDLRKKILEGISL